MSEMGLLELVKSINWELESPPIYQDFRVLPLFAVFFPSIRFLLDRFVFEVLLMLLSLDSVAYPLLFCIISYVPLVIFENWQNILIYGKHRQDMGDDRRERKKRIRKFKESAWKCVYYLSAEILALFVTYNEPWFMNTKYFWVGSGDQTWPDQQTK